MKVLFITAFPPNRMTAGQNYTKNLLEDLANLNDIELVYFDYAKHNIEIQNLNTKRKRLNIVKKVFNCLKLPFVHPFFSARFSFRLMFYILKNKKKFDLIYLDFSQVFIYSLFIKKEKTILMSHDVIYQKYSRRKKKIDLMFGRCIKFWEKKLLKKAGKVLVFSDKDVKLIHKYFDLKAYRVDFYMDKYIEEINHHKIEINKNFCFYGAWNRKENLEGLIWFIQSVIPKVPHANFIIIGGSMSEEIKLMFKNYTNIKYIGFVDNPYEIIAASQALIAPVFNGAGVKVKVLESLCCGTAVLGTQVAFEGINNLETIKNDVFYCDDADTFIKTLNQFVFKNVNDKISLRNKFIYPERKALDIIIN